MKTFNARLGLAASLLAASLTGASAASQLRLTDGTPGGTITIVDQGPGDSNSVVGAIFYTGDVGPNWFVGAAAGVTKPLVGGATVPYMDLNTFYVSHGAGSLKIEFTDTDFTEGGTVTASIGGNTPGTVTYNAWLDPANVPFAKSVSLSAIGPLSGGAFQETQLNHPINPHTAYSLTLETIIQHSGPGATGFDSDLFIKPPPKAAIGNRVWLDTNTNGLQDAGEPGVADVVVLLMDCEDTVLSVTNTDANGLYFFSDLKSGNYNIRVLAPSGYTFTLRDQGTDDAADSDSDANGLMICTLLDAGETDLSWDAGLIRNILPSPCMQVLKVADFTVSPSGGEMGYTYTVTNCGSTTLENVYVQDDAGTPDFSGDDFLVGTVPSLAPGAAVTFRAFTILPVNMCTNSGGVTTQQGMLTTEVLANGDIKATYRQSRNVNENVYQPVGNPPGWSRTHKFSDLTGSDKAEFRWTDGNGKVVLDFYLDYLSASASFPSGYGSLGVAGGDGAMIVGNKTNVLSWTTTISDNLNQSPAFYGYTTNSPTEPNPLWDYVDGFTVIVSKNAFGTPGFGGVTVPLVHNSPAKSGANAIVPTPCATCVTNIATAGTNYGGPAGVMATAHAEVCPGSSECGMLGACTPPYPFVSSNPLTSIPFNESEVLRTGIVSVVMGCIPNQIQIFYNDEHALMLGVREVIVRSPGVATGTKGKPKPTKPGKTPKPGNITGVSITNQYAVTPLTTIPGSAINPQVGSTASSGDQAGTDVSGRPLFPALFVTDLTLNPLNPYAGDWQNGGTAIPPHAVFGTWKSATRTVDKTRSPEVVTLSVDPDPAKNDWNLGPGSDPVPPGLKNEGYGAEIRWDISRLGLVSGHTYRLYFMVHDGDQNKSGGDVGQSCGIITMP